MKNANSSKQKKIQVLNFSIIILMIFSLPFFSSCDKDPDFDSDPLKGLYGEWERNLYAKGYASVNILDTIHD